MKTSTVETDAGHAAEMRRCIAELDVTAARALWHHLAPKAPAPKTDIEALQVLHYARTMTQTISLRLRAYSHHWLTDQGLPTGLPDELKKKADRLYPQIADSVGIACKSSFPEVSQFIQRAMETVVYDCYADNHREPTYIKPRMMEARVKAKKTLHGILSEAAERELRQRTLASLRKERPDG